MQILRCIAALALILALPLLQSTYAVAGSAIAKPTPVQHINAGRTAPAGNTLNIATLNLAHGRGGALNQLLVSAQTTRQNLETVGRVLQQQDIHVVALQEADAPSLWSGRFDHTTLVAKHGGFGWYASSPHAHLGIGHYGTSVASTLPMLNAQNHDFPPSLPTARKGLTLAELNWSTTEGDVILDIVSIHMDFSRKSVRQTQLRELRQALAGRTNPLIIMGDFNSVEIARQLMDEERDNGRYLHTPGDTGPEFHSYKSKRLDWILISSELEFIDYTTFPDNLSDHKLVTARVSLRDNISE